MAKIILAVVLFLQGCVTSNGFLTPRECQTFMQTEVRDYMKTNMYFTDMDAIGTWTIWHYETRMHPDIRYTLIHTETPMSPESKDLIKASLLVQCAEDKLNFYVYGASFEYINDEPVPRGWHGPVYE